MAGRRLHARLNVLLGFGRYDEALAVVEAHRDSPLTSPQRLVMMLAFVELMHSPRFGAIAEQVALVEPQLSESDSSLLVSTRLRRALRLRDVDALAALPVSDDEVQLRRWQLAALRNDAAATQAVFDEAARAEVTDEVRLLRVYALLGRDDAAAIAEAKRAVGETSSFLTRTHLQVLQAEAHWRRGERTEACAALVLQSWATPLLPAEHTLLRTMIGACPALASMKLPPAP